ncbi:MAG: hypothetical protein CR967_01290 [Proteobacteria bacterium]|nr:MAG: hypothetical protein CR967_01290 [Pseudomonadota bacterium]
MNIFFDGRVLTHKNFTGVEYYAKNIFDNLKNKCDIKFVRPSFSNRYFAHLRTHLKLPFIVKDLLFCPANVAPIFLPKKTRLVLTLHDVSFLVEPKNFSLFFRLYYRLIVPINIKRADKIITVSNFSKREIIKFFPDVKHKIEVIYLGVDYLFRSKKTRKKNFILYVGSFNERKNFINVIKAYNLLKAKEIKLILVGNFDENFSLSKEAKDALLSAQKNSNIIFKQNITQQELIDLYSQAKLFLYPSFYEGFGLPILESMACGTPVV